MGCQAERKHAHGSNRPPGTGPTRAPPPHALARRRRPRRAVCLPPLQARSSWRGTRSGSRSSSSFTCPGRRTTPARRRRSSTVARWASPYRRHRPEAWLWARCQYSEVGRVPPGPLPARLPSRPLPRHPVGFGPPAAPPCSPPAAWPPQSPRGQPQACFSWPASSMLLSTQAAPPTAACATGSTPPRSASSTAGSLPSEHPALLRRRGNRVARSAGGLQKCPKRADT